MLVLVLANTGRFADTGAILDLFRWGNILLFGVLLVMTNWIKPLKKLHPIVFIAIAAVCGVVFRMGGA